MRLSSYLSNRGLTEPEFAELIEVSQAAVNRYVNGKRTPNFEMIRKIETATHGAVGINDWYSPEPTQETAP